MNLLKKINKLARKNLMFTYTVAFLVTAILVFSAFWVSGISFVWSVDGSKQHYPALVYLGKWLRQIISSLLSGKGFHAKMWDMNLGYGSDVLTTLNYYSFGDPLDILSVFVPTKFTEYLYDFLCVFRLYLAGVTFIFYCKQKEYNTTASVIGALAYSFSGFSLIFAVRHPFFINPLIYLPLLLVGVERLIVWKKSLLFHIIIVISFVSNFYFSYMLLIFTFIYAILFYVQQNGFSNVKKFMAALGRGVFATLLGLANAAVIMLPVILSFFQTERSEVSSSQNLFLYNLSYYTKLPSVFLYPQENSTSTVIGMFGLSVITFFLVLRTRERRFFVLRCSSVGMLIALIFPIFGYGMNGFSYACNRWSFLLVFIIAVSFVVLWDKLWELNKKDWRVIAIITGFYFVALFFPQARNENNLMVFIILLFEIMMLVAINYFKLLQEKKHVAVTVIVVCLVLNVFANGYYRFSVTEDDVSSAYFESGTVYERLTDDATGDFLNSLHDKKEYRVDSLDRESRNYGVLEEIPTVSTYFSITPEHYTMFSRIMGNAAEECTVSVGNLDSRLGLHAIFGVKYVTTDSLHEGSKIPYGYDLKNSKVDTTYNGQPVVRDIYKNNLGISMIYSNAHVISYSDFMNESTEKREEIMLNNVVVEDDSSLLNGKYDSLVQYSGKVILTKEEIMNQLSNIEGIEIEGEKIIVKQNDLQADLNVKRLTNSDTKLYINQMQYKYMDKYEQYKRNKLAYSRIDERKARLNKFIEEYPSYTRVFAFCKEKSGYMEYKTNVSTTQGIDTSIINLGYNVDGTNKIAIKFEKAGYYEFKDIQVIGQKIQPYKNAIKKMNSCQVDSFKIEGNDIDADVNLSEDAPICIAVPYNSGWSARINGKTVPVEKGNIVFMVIEGHKGANHIQLKYRTPGLKTGFFVSVGATFIVILYYWRRRSRHRYK